MRIRPQRLCFLSCGLVILFFTFSEILVANSRRDLRLAGSSVPMTCRNDFPAMCNSLGFVVVLIMLLHSSVVLVSSERSNGSSSWKTLHGNAPLVIARGGLSGLFPDSSSYAYILAAVISVPDVVLWCDVQLTRDGSGICLPDLKLENSTDIADIYNRSKNSYSVNGVKTTAWFSIDFTLHELGSVTINQGIYTRTTRLDGNKFRILTVQDVAAVIKPHGLWLNIQHDAFFSQHNLSMRNYVFAVSRTVDVSYISSPEVAFLRSISKRFKSTKTKLVFRFLKIEELEPTTNQTYGSLLSNLTFIKTFASGILVPKFYIWPVDTSGYLLSRTSLVADAHKRGLEVFASEFYNDIPLSYNYSFDPVTEYLSYVDNGDFSVDGVLSDFSITPSLTIDCFAHLGNTNTKQARPLVISKFGASGDYPGCTDLAYTKAISDGVEILDCPVQIAKDGTPFCASSINLIDSTTIAETDYSNLSKTIPEIKTGSGIFAFDLTWPQISGLTPAILNPYSKNDLYRNHAFENSGKFLTLASFLAVARNTSSLLGVLISIENAAYLLNHKNLSVVDKVLDGLSKAGYDNRASQKVMIKSTNSAVLKNIRGKSKYLLVYEVDETISDALDSTIMDIKSFSDAVVIGKSSVFPVNSFFLTGATDVVERLQAVNLSVYVETFSNEFLSQAWDFFSDSTVEINSYFMGADIDGVITDFPKTSARYKRNRCLNLGNKTPVYMTPVKPGSLFQLITSQYLPPALAPSPVLRVSDIAEPPLADSGAPSPAGSTGAAPTAPPPPPPPPNSQPKLSSFFSGSRFGILLAALVLLGNL